MFSFLLLLPLVSNVANAKNDWSIPCLSGWCEYDSGNGVESAFGAMTLSGPPTAISDLTKAAGWHILECDPLSKEPQTIRMVCQSADADAAGCSHIDQGGAQHTIVRLPESCSAGPFARVDRKWTSEDQSVPPSISKLIKRENPNPEVVNVKIDFDFSKIPADKGPVSLLASATNIPGQEQTLGGDAVQQKTLRRGYGSRHRVYKRGFISDVINKLKKLNKFDKSFKDKLPPINLKKNFPLFDQSISCPAAPPLPGFDAKFSMNVDTNLNAVVTFGYIITGTIVPPKIDDLALYSDLNADASATFNINAAAKATVDSGVINIFSVGLPGLDFPGIITLGPSFSIGTQVKASLGTTGNLQVGAKFTMPQIELVFPSKQGQSIGSGEVLESPLKLSINPSLELAGNVEAHLIPRVDLGATILGGVGKASVFLSMDVNGKLGMNVKGTAGVIVDPSKPAPDISKALSGCVDMSVGMDVKAGAQGALKPFFDETASIDLFKKDFSLLHKCFGDAKRDLTPSPSPIFAKRDLTCGGLASTATSLIDQLVKP